ncbi:regulator of G-protein signaling 21 isoform X1 [Megalops cyprinoides]|uniref:regulator of G-protein signaling 21 isoform X1 n=1 Tax=Megalops cyprinoides TaxID=118141 RepID=UPI001863B246|nr:regulator of G-protein signaling 21 isoform X1 [Megalops cyprinoides]
MPKLRFSKIRIYEFKNLFKEKTQKMNRKNKKNDIQCILLKKMLETSIFTYFKRQDGEKGLQPTLEKLLKDKSFLAAFRMFLQSEFSEENIEFWLACKDYSGTVSPAERSCKAAEIYQEFLHPQAKKEINIDYHTRERIKRAMQDPDPSCFNEAERHVYRLMEIDSCPRFLKSEIYWNLQNKAKASC